MVSEMVAETQMEEPQRVEEPHQVELVPDFDQKLQATERLEAAYLNPCSRNH